MPSARLGHAMHYAIYVPESTSGSAPLPVIYLLHGVGAAPADWLAQGHLQAVADRLIAEGRLPPTLIVMPDAGNSWYVDSADIGGPGDMAAAVAAELPAWIEAHYRARRDRGGRAIAGYSMGGFGALRLALAHPDRYVAVAAMSGAFWTRVTRESRFDEVRMRRIFAGSFGRPFDPRRFLAASPMTLLGRLPRSGPRPDIYLTCGIDDPFGLAAEETTVAAALRAAGLGVERHDLPGGHDWDTWSAALPAVLSFLGRHF